MLKSRLLMQPPIMLRLVMSGVLACSFSANGLRADDGNKVDPTKVELKPLIELKPAGAPAANPLPGVARPPTEFMPSVAVPSPEISRPTLPLPPKLITAPVPLIDLRPKADLAPPVAPKLPELAPNPLEAVKPVDAPKPEPLPEGLPPVTPLNSLNPDVPVAVVPELSRRARVVLDVETTGQTHVTLDGKAIGHMSRLLGGQREASASEVTFSQLDERTVNISSRTREVIVETSNIPGLAAAIRPNNSAAFRIMRTKNYVDVLTPATLTESVVVRLPDGGAAELGADSALRFDLLPDNSYHVSGIGTVKAQTAEGQFVMLSLQQPLSSPTPQAQTMERSITEAPRPPLPGGLQLSARDVAGNPSGIKISAAVEVAISGTFTDGLNLRVGDRLVVLNSAKPSEIVTLPTGAEIEFSLDANGKTLSWNVHKGYFALTMDTAASEAFQFWRAFALTEQSGTLSWDKSQIPHTLTLKNTTPGGPLHANSLILVDLGKGVSPYNNYFDSPQPGFYASVRPDATFSYSPSQTPKDPAGNYNLRVGASAPAGGVNIYRVFPNIASLVPGTTDAMYNKELLLGTECFCLEAASLAASLARGAPRPISPSPGAPGLVSSIRAFSLPPGNLGKPKFALPPATLGP